MSGTKGEPVATLPMLPAGSRSHNAAKRDEQRAGYFEQVKQAQALLQHGRFDGARKLFAEALARLDERASYERAAITEQLGRCLLLGGDAPAATAAYQEALAIVRQLPLGDGSKRLECAIQSGLGDTYRASGQFAEARAAYEAAIALSKMLKDERAQAIDFVHLGGLHLLAGEPQDAAGVFRAALDLFRRTRDTHSQALAQYQLGRTLHAMGASGEAEAQLHEAHALSLRGADHAGAAQTALQLAAVAVALGRRDDAETWYRNAIDAASEAELPSLARQSRCALAQHLMGSVERRAEVRRLLEEALASVTLDDFAGDVWDAYGMLGSVLRSQAADTCSPVLAAHADNFEHLSQFGPRLHASLTTLGSAASYGRAVLAHRIGHCFILGNRYDLGLASFHEAIALIARLPPTKAAERLRVLALLDFASALRAGKQAQEARDYYRKALDAARSLGDLRAQYAAADCLAEVALEADCSAEAVAHAKAALQITRTLNHRQGEIGALQRLGYALEAAESWSEAKSCHDQMAELCEAHGDSSGAALARERSEIAGRNSVKDVRAGENEAAGQPAPAQPSEDRFTVSLRHDLATDCVFASDILIELGEETRIADWAEAPSGLDDDVCPQLPPYARTFLSDQGRVCIDVPSGEPSYEDMSGCVLMRRTHRSITLSGPAGIAWKVLAALDGVRTVRDILAEVPIGQRPAARGLLDLLAATELLDISGRPVGQFVHSATKKGVLAGGGLRSDAIMRLVTDGGYRTYADAPRVELSSIVPGNLQTFHDLTRRRRSRRDYDGREISRDELAALLSTACGVTGTMSWSDGGTERIVKLRAYPSSGALYSVEIYPVAFRIKGLDAGVYHYAAEGNCLSQVRAHASNQQITPAILPAERAMVAGAATMICLVGQFRRHEQKYGEGGYRMLVAEAGHISQTLILAATALGLAARPLGGVFDQLLNRELGLDESDEQFLLSVVVGHAGE
jgi:SagB-type dehydrogenase family enzyme